jgi:hypothetical protein
MAPKRRIQHTKEHKKRVHKFYQAIRPNSKPPTQVNCVTFAAKKLGIKINQSLVSKWLSKKHSYLNIPSSSSSTAAFTRRRHRDRPFNTLEIALYKWIKRMEVTLTITGAILKTKAS